MSGDPHGTRLCLRCEHRARFYETERAMRCECGMAGDHGVYSCYMFLPCKPVVVTNRDTLNRPSFGPPLIAGRVSGVALAEDARLVLRVAEYADKQLVAAWRVKPAKRAKKGKAR